MDSTPLLFVFYIFLLFIAKGVIKNVPDYYGDLSAGLKTSATFFVSLRQSGIFAFVMSTFVYLLLPVFVYFLKLPNSLLFTFIWIPFAIIHTTRFFIHNTPIRLNHALKWDMVSSTLYISLLSFTVVYKSPIFILWFISFFLFWITVIIQEDSRKDSFVRQK